MDAAFKALADRTRRHILRLVGTGELSAGQIAEAFEVTRPAVSQHLTALKRAGLVSERRAGARRLYRARPQGMAAALLFLERFWDERLAALGRAAETPVAGGAAPMTERLCVTREVTMAAPREVVWELLTDAARMTGWMGRAAELAPHPGGRYRVEVVPGQVASGAFVEVDAPARLAHTWGWDGYARAVVPPGSSLVAYELVRAPAGTLLRLDHHYLPSARSAGTHARGWGHYLGRLAMLAAGGDPGPDPWVTDPGRLGAEPGP